MSYAKTHTYLAYAPPPHLAYTYRHVLGHVGHKGPLDGQRTSRGGAKAALTDVKVWVSRANQAHED